MATRLLLPVLTVLAIATSAVAADDKLTVTLRGVVEEHIRAYNDENVDGVLRTMHTRSPEYDPTKAALPEQFEAMDLTVKLVDFKYMGHDDEFVVARVRTQVMDAPGGGFNDNVTDSIMLFHKEGGVWKLWSDDVLGVELAGQ